MMLLLWLLISSCYGAVINVESDLNYFTVPVKGENISHLSDWEKMPWSELKTAIELENQQNVHRPLKVLYFIRHAEGKHNAAEAKYGTQAWDEIYSKSIEFLDATLTENGRKSALAQHEILNPNVPVDKVIVSPLSRAIETALLLFQDKDLPFIAYEECRETMGIHTCDQRHNVSYLKSHFPSVDFTRLWSPADTLWSKTHRETQEEIQTRAANFLERIYRQEAATFLAIVSHHGFITACLQELNHPMYDIGNTEFVPVVVQEKSDPHGHYAFILLLFTLFFGLSCVVTQSLVKNGTPHRHLTTKLYLMLLGYLTTCKPCWDKIKQLLPNQSATIRYTTLAMSNEDDS